MGYLSGARYLGTLIIPLPGRPGDPQVLHLLLDMLDTENSQSVKKSVRYSYPPLLNPSSSRLLHPASPLTFLSRDKAREMSPQTLSLSLIP